MLFFLTTQNDDIWNWVKIIINEYWPLLLTGMIWTLVISLSSTLIGLGLAMLITPIKIQTITKRDSFLTKILKNAGIILTTIYVEVLRGTPMMVQAMIIYYGLLTRNVGVIISGIIIVSINTSAYVTEVLRGSISSIDKGQMEAARSLGMTRSQAMFTIIIPQALKNSIPAIGNEFVINIKDTAVLNVIGVTELFFITDQINGTLYRSYEAYIITVVLYLIMTFTTTRLLYLISSKLGDKKLKSFPTSQSM